MRDLRSLQDLYAHNDWANAQVFAICHNLDQRQLEEQAAGTYGTIEETLKHLVGVEQVYLAMLRDQPIGSESSREEYFGRDLTWFGDRSRQLGKDYIELLASRDTAFADQPLKVPWFDFELSKHDGLLQVLTHSAQHRAQVFSVLGHRGVEVPDLDYVLYVEKGQGEAQPE